MSQAKAHDSAVRHSTVTLCKLFSATRLQFLSSRSVSENDIPPDRQQAPKAKRSSQITSEDLSSLQPVSPAESSFSWEQHSREPLTGTKP